ncbi:MAG: chromosome partitioning protein ParB, partial [Defluviitaleaceae bacterium]|nr:chromosome partitioning protein ParB [Defluviitaleaceae bacterium]
EEVAQSSGESVTQIKRYIRLTELIPPILDMVDEAQLAMRPAVELSYLPQEQQHVLLDVIASEGSTPSHVQAAKIRTQYNEGILDSGAILSIMQEDSKPAQIQHYKLPSKSINRFFPAGTPAQTIEETIIQALELWHNQQKPRPD